MRGRTSSAGLQLMWAALAISIVLGLAGLFLDISLRQRLLQREGAIAQEFLESIVRSEKIGPALFANSSRAAELTRFADHVVAFQGTFRATIYSLDGFIRHSTEPNLVGIKFHDNEELQQAIEGALVVNLESNVDKSEQLGLSQLAGDSLIETYIPVHDGEGRMIAVVEYYKQPDALFATIAAGRRDMVATLAMAALALFAFAVMAQRKAVGS